MVADELNSGPARMRDGVRGERYDLTIAVGDFFESSELVVSIRRSVFGGKGVLVWVDPPARAPMNPPWRLRFGRWSACHRRLDRAQNKVDRFPEDAGG